MSDSLTKYDSSRDSFIENCQNEFHAGVRALWLKVIIRAMFDWVSYRDSPKLIHKRLADQAHDWLFNQSNVFNGFENICNQIDINPEWVRRKAACMTKSDVAKIEHLERSSSSPVGELDEAEHEQPEAELAYCEEDIEDYSIEEL